jgi:hypothetical protein
MAVSRVFLVLALVAMMLVGAFADRALLKSSTDKADKATKTGDKATKSYGKGSKALKYKCSKTFKGCKTCSGSVSRLDYLFAALRCSLCGRLGESDAPLRRAPRRLGLLSLSPPNAPCSPYSSGSTHTHTPLPALSARCALLLSPLAAAPLTLSPPAAAAAATSQNQNHHNVQDDDGSYTCDVCADANAVFNGEACVCDSDAGYGTITKAQIKAYYKANKGSKTKHYSKYAKCVLCADYGLEASEGVCVAPADDQ